MSAAGLTRTAVWCETLEGGIEDIRDVVVHDRVGLAVILHAARIESGERSGVSPPVRRSCTGKLTHAAHQLSHS